MSVVLLLSIWLLQVSVMVATETRPHDGVCVVALCNNVCDQAKG